jgi:hypothetical protein
MPFASPMGACMDDQKLIERFQAIAQTDHVGARLDNTEHNCASHGPQAHFARITADGSVELLAAPCMRWSCRACGPETLLPRLRKELIRAVSEHDLRYWVTLTLVHPRNPDPIRLAKRLAAAWKAFRDLYRKQFGKPLRYVWLKEVHKGAPHLHVFTQPIDERWVKKTWHSLTGAYQVKAVLLESDEDIARRVCYATKSTCGNATEYGTTCGRWRGTSRGIHLRVRPRSPGGSGWRMMPGPIDLSRYPASACRVEWADRVGRPKKVIVAAPGRSL